LSYKISDIVVVTNHFRYLKLSKIIILAAQKAFLSQIFEMKPAKLKYFF